MLDELRDLMGSDLGQVVSIATSIGFFILALIKLLITTLGLKTPFWKRVEVACGAILLGFFAWVTVLIVVYLCLEVGRSHFNGTWLMMPLVAFPFLYASFVYFVVWPYLLKKVARDDL